MTIGDLVQFRWEPQTGGMILGKKDGFAHVRTFAGAYRDVPTHALRKVRVRVRTAT